LDLLDRQAGRSHRSQDKVVLPVGVSLDINNFLTILKKNILKLQHYNERLPDLGTKKDNKILISINIYGKLKYFYK
jgi:hypothetical protein